MLVQETIICSTAPTSSTSSPGLIALHDIQTGQALASFKQTSSAHHSVAISESTNTQGGFILAAQAEKSLLNVYNFQKVNKFSNNLCSFTWLMQRGRTNLPLKPSCQKNWHVSQSITAVFFVPVAQLQAVSICGRYLPHTLHAIQSHSGQHLLF